MKRLSLVFSMLVLGLASSALANGVDPFGNGGLPNVTCAEQFANSNGYTTYLVLLGNSGLVVDAPINDPFDDVCVYFPNSAECKNRPPRPPKASKAVVRYLLNVESVTANTLGTIATGSVSARSAEGRGSRFQLNLQYSTAGYLAKLTTAAGDRIFNCATGLNAFGGAVVQ